MNVESLALLDSYRLISGAVVDLQDVPPATRLFLSDLALRLAQGQGYSELVGRIMSPTSVVYGGLSPLAPEAQELPAVRVARDLVYRAGVAEGAIEGKSAEAGAAIPRGLRTVRNESGDLQPVETGTTGLTREQIVTVGEAMKLLSITRQAVINAVRNQKIRGEQHGRLWILSREDVLRYHAERTRRRGR